MKFKYRNILFENNQLENLLEEKNSIMVNDGPDMLYGIL